MGPKAEALSMNQRSEGILPAAELEEKNGFLTTNGTNDRNVDGSLIERKMLSRGSVFSFGIQGNLVYLYFRKG